MPGSCSLLTVVRGAKIHNDPKNFMSDEPTCFTYVCRRCWCCSLYPQAYGITADMLIYSPGEVSAIAAALRKESAGILTSSDGTADSTEMMGESDV